MDTLTHALAGLIAYFSENKKEERKAVLALLYILAANAPDIDHLWILEHTPLSFIYQPRVLCHNLIALFCFAAILFILSKKLAGRVLPLLVVQPFAHVVLDAANYGGVALLYPWRNEFYSISGYLIDQLSGKNVLYFSATAGAVYSMLGGFALAAYSLVVIIAGEILREKRNTRSI